MGATSGVLVATLLPAFGRFVTATIRVGDGVQVNASATVAVTMFYALATVRATGPTGVVTVLAESVAPVTLATLSATGGLATLQFAVAADALGGVSVGATSGVLVATLLPAFGSFATATIRVGDGVQVNASTTVAVTVFRRPPVEIRPSSVSYLISPDYSGAVHTMTATGGGRGLSL